VHTMAEPSSIENSPGAQAGQPEGSGRPSAEKAKPETGPESTDSKTAPAATTAAATDEKDKQQPAEGATATSQTEGATKAAPAGGELLASDSTATSPPANQVVTNATTATGAAANAIPTTQNPGPSPDPEKFQESAPTLPMGGPILPSTDEPDPMDIERRRRLLIIHLRLAKFFNWLLLLAFVILPGTFSRNETSEKSTSTSTSTTTTPTPTPTPTPTSSTHFHQISSKPLFAAVYVCTILNACAIGRLWYLRRNDPEFLYLNLFLPGLTYSFSGLITTLVNLWAVQHGHLGAATTTTIIITCLATAIYGVLCVYYRPEHLRAQAARLSRGIYI